MRLGHDSGGWLARASRARFSFNLEGTGGNTGQDARPALTYYDDGATWTVMISMSLYLLCWTDDA